jgi:hypothetical protein
MLSVILNLVFLFLFHKQLPINPSKEPCGGTALDPRFDKVRLNRSTSMSCLCFGMPSQKIQNSNW